MVKKHLKRLAMPKTWPLPRKTSKRVIRPLPGKHSFSMGMPLGIILKDILNFAETTRDVRNILKNKEILADGKTARSHKQIIGLMDILEIPKMEEAFRIIIGRNGKLSLAKARKEEFGLKLCKITGKKMNKGKVQLSLHDGRTVMAEAGNNTYKIGDSLLIKVPEQKVMEHIKIGKNSIVYLTGGSHIGQTGNIKEISNEKIIIKSDEGEFETLKRFAFVIGNSKPAISFGE